MSRSKVASSAVVGDACSFALGLIGCDLLHEEVVRLLRSAIARKAAYCYSRTNVRECW